MDIVNFGSSLPLKYINATGAQYPQSGAGRLTPFGMRQMHMRGREMRQRYIKDKQYLSLVANPDEFFTYAIDGDRTYASAMSFMTGLYPGGAEGPAALFKNQSDIAVPPITLTLPAPTFDTALPNNFQMIPVHSDVGYMNSTVF